MSKASKKRWRCGNSSKQHYAQFFFTCEHYFSDSRICAKTIFTSKFKLFCRFRHDFQISDVCIKGDSIVELQVLGGKVVGGGVKDNCEYSGLIFYRQETS